MTTITNIQAKNNFTTVKLFVAVIVFMLSGNSAFSQSKVVTETTPSTEVAAPKKATLEVVTENAVASSTMDFALWFTGSTKTTESKSNNGSFNKKQLINSGINTNSVLIRSFLKKINNQGNSVA